MRSVRSAACGRLAITTMLAISAAWSIPAAAAAEQQLQVSPTKTQLQAEAGQTLTANITITAPESGIKVDYQHADFGFDEDYQVVLIPDTAPDTTSFSTRRWFTVAPPQFPLKARATRTVPVRIKVPDNTPSGTYMGAAIFAVAPDDDAAGGQIQANVSIASLIFVSVAGGDPPMAKIRRFDVPRLVTRGSFTPELIVDNTGTLGFTADGSIRIDGKDPQDRQTYAPQYVQPDKPRTLKVQGEKKQTARVDTSKLGMGRHTIELRLRIDPTNQTLVVKKTFWVIPMWIRILTGVLLVALVLGISWLVATFRRKRRDRTDAKAVTALAGSSVDPALQPDPDIPPAIEPAVTVTTTTTTTVSHPRIESTDHGHVEDDDYVDATSFVDPADADDISYEPEPELDEDEADDDIDDASYDEPSAEDDDFDDDDLDADDDADDLSDTPR